MGQNIGVYKIGSKINPDKIYVGSSLNLKMREHQHFYELKKGRHRNKYLQNHFNEIGIQDTEFVVLQNCHKQKLQSCEQIYIDLLNPMFNINHVASRNGEGNNKSNSCKFLALKDMDAAGRYVVQNERSVLRRMQIIKDILLDDPEVTLVNDQTLMPIHIFNDSEYYKTSRGILVREIKRKYGMKSWPGIFQEVSENILRELLIFGEHEYLIMKYIQRNHNI